MTTHDRTVLLALARKSVRAAVYGEEPPDLPESDICRMPGGAFVTLKSSGRLRGCIGHFTGLGTLGSTVIAMAREAALSDPRFIPVSPEEISGLTIEISVLSPMKRIEAGDVVPGKHGLYIRQGVRAGTLLPQVALEEGWSRETFLSHTCIKAGLSPDAYKSKDTEIFAYTAEVFSENETGKEV